MFRCNLPPAPLQNDRGLLRATAVTRGVGAEGRSGGGGQTPNKSQHIKLTLEKKILPPLLPGFELATFRSRVRDSYQPAIPAVNNHIDSASESCRCQDSRLSTTTSTVLLTAVIAITVGCPRQPTTERRQKRGATCNHPQV